MNEMTTWYKAKLDVLESELKRLVDGVAPDYAQDKDVFGNTLMRSEMLKDEIEDLRIALSSHENTN